MSVPLLFSLVSVAALVGSLAVVLLLRGQLRRVLVDLCDGEHRAEFWVAMSGVWIVLIGLLAGTATLGYSASDGSTDLFGGATEQVRLFILGLLGAVLAIACVLLYAISHRNRSDDVPNWPAAPPAVPPELPANRPQAATPLR